MSDATPPTILVDTPMGDALALVLLPEETPPGADAAGTPPAPEKRPTKKAKCESSRRLDF